MKGGRVARGRQSEGGRDERPGERSPGREELRRGATQRDIARLAGVSQATASSVLSGGAQRVAPETRRRVLEAAAELGYRANPLAQGLKGAPTGLLGVIVRDLGAPAAALVCRELAHLAPEYGFDVLITDAADRTATFLRLARLMESRLCEGIVLVGELADQAEAWASSGVGVPMLALLHSGKNVPFPVVQVDNAAGIDQAVAHLAALGHERIGYVGTAWLSGVQARETAFRQSMQRRELALREEDVIVTAPSREGGAQVVRELMRRPSRPLALVASTDLIASGIVREAQRLGVHVPQGLSVVGFDDIPEAALLQPSLTTVRQPYREMAQRALHFFQGLRRDEEVGSLGTIPSRLVVRESTAPPSYGRHRPPGFRDPAGLRSPGERRRPARTESAGDVLSPDVAGETVPGGAREAAVGRVSAEGSAPRERP